ncbi:hypothetical protein SCLCIDRAFT_908870 [Scleroderma citrinum Foug A]|uniref:Uncharacterized protein n=1 Tax=Scleroderma citrinum Foug A TaxID=1036808 RepID=A0A0C3A8K8_9AGAM|nr:hypothetical protein SCLCIDRAFT_908870 [Scleroderma citrinum Foug A]
MKYFAYAHTWSPALRPSPKPTSHTLRWMSALCNALRVLQGLFQITPSLHNPIYRSGRYPGPQNSKNASHPRWFLSSIRDIINYAVPLPQVCLHRGVNLWDLSLLGPIGPIPFGVFRRT